MDRPQDVYLSALKSVMGIGQVDYDRNGLTTLTTSCSEYPQALWGWIYDSDANSNVGAEDEPKTEARMVTLSW